MKLYYSKGACSLAVRILLHEMGIPCEFELVNLQTKKTEKGEDFLAINPKGAVPTLKLDTGEILTENGVIQQYLADKHHATKLFPPNTQFDHYQVLEWMNYVATDLHKNCSPLFNPNIPAELKEKMFVPYLRTKFDYVDKHLKNRNYLVGNSFTLPDAYLFTVARWLPHFGIDRKSWPHLSRFFEACKEKKSVLQALSEEQLSAD